jgi:hypothetical protein
MRPQELFQLIGAARDGDDFMMRRASDPEQLELHWTDRDAFLARLERDYPRGGELNGHGRLWLFGVRITENNSVAPGFAFVSSAYGEPLTVALRSDTATVRR